MNSNQEIVDSIIRKTQSFGVLVDTNLLLLFLIGLVNKSLVTSHSRLGNYIEEDFEMLNKLLGRYSRILVTPTILAEISNLAGDLSGEYKRRFSELLKEFTSTESEEIYKSITSYNSSKSFCKFGVTDSNITKVAHDGPLVLTDDLPLAQYLQSKSLAVLNFNHIRTYGW